MQVVLWMSLLLGVTPAVLNSGLDNNSSKVGIMEGVVFVTLRPVCNRFDRGNSLGILDQHFLLDQSQGALLPEQEKTTDTIHVNLGLVNLGLWALLIPRGKITEQVAVGTLHQFLTYSVSCGSHA